MAQRMWEGREALAARSADVPQAATQRLIRALEPAAAVVLVSDMIFADPGDAVAGFVRAAQRSRREFLVVELDSFAAEVAQADLGRPVLRAAFEGHPAAGTAGRIGQGDLDQARAAIDALRADRRHQWQGGGMYWPEASALPVPVTRTGLQRFFALGFPRHPVVRALVARGGVT